METESKHSGSLIVLHTFFLRCIFGDIHREQRSGRHRDSPQADPYLEKQTEDTRIEVIMRVL